MSVVLVLFKYYEDMKKYSKYLSKRKYGTNSRSGLQLRFPRLSRSLVIYITMGNMKQKWVYTQFVINLKIIEESAGEILQLNTLCG